MPRFQRKIRLAALIAAPLVLAGCTPTVANRGNLVDAERLAAVRPGVTKDEVFQSLGSPTMVATFDDNTWYYVGQRTEQTAFLDAELTDRQIVVVRFDEGEKVRLVEKLDKSAAIDVRASDATTAASGRDLSFFEQLVGSVGRFTGDKKKPAGGGAGPSRGGY